jgi:hypothetical protein
MVVTVKQRAMTYTSADLATEFDKEDSRIRQLAREHKVGVCHMDRIWIFTERDREWFRRYFRDHGRNFGNKA